MRILPFLYLPDAVTLILLLVVLGMLRRAAVDHIRQELLSIRREMLSYWLNNALDFSDCGYIALRNLIDSSLNLAPRLTPGRLLFLYRLHRNTALTLPDPSLEASLLIQSTANGREKLKRLQMEMNLGLGVFFLTGSISGWFLLLIIVSKMLKRTISHRKYDRVDFFFDMVEKVLLCFGRQAQQIGRAGA